MRYALGPLHIDVDQRAVFHHSEILSLPPKSFDILLLLVHNAGQIVSRDTIRDTIWPSSFIEEANINNNISRLRATLREHLDDVDPIQTVPKRGYRFTADISRETAFVQNPQPFARRASDIHPALSIQSSQSTQPSAAAMPLSPSTYSRVSSAKLAIVAALIAILLAAGAALEHWRPRPRHPDPPGPSDRSRAARLQPHRPKSPQHALT